MRRGRLIKTAFDEPDEPEEEDLVMEDARGGGVSVSLYGHKHLETLDDRDEAEKFIKQYMRHHNWYPNVWFISDHGNAHLVTDIA
jgi:hypothetical protein